MHPPMRALSRLMPTLLLAAHTLIAQSAEDPLAAWRKDVKISVVSPEHAERHTIHSYFNTCPESPDGSKVLFFASATTKGHSGDVMMRDRATGKETVLATNVNVEDAHRVACQQWVSNGKRVVFHGERDGVWFVAAVDLDTLKERVLARGQLSCWGQPNADIVPLYGPHWDPGDHRDLDLLNVATGEIKTALKLEAVKAAYPDWYAKQFGDKSASIFFPILSPDLKRVYFKMAATGNGDPRSKGASDRQGLICYSLDEKRFLYMHGKWGHPSWQSDSRHITETSFFVFDSNDGSLFRTPGLPGVRGDHPSASPDGRLIVTDTTMDKFGGKASDWGIVLADARGNNHIIIHQFDNSHGAKSWRVSHPHPSFSADGKRIYFNVSSGPWTQLHVAEISGRSLR